jgi:hypothetical protein
LDQSRLGAESVTYVCFLVYASTPVHQGHD